MKRILKWTGVTAFFFVIFTIILDLALGYLLFNFAFGKTGLASLYNENAGTPDTEWFSDNNTQVLHEKADDGTNLVAKYVPSEKPSNKTVIVVHGYGSNSEEMEAFIKIFHADGYNVLAPDNQSFGGSGGKYIGYGVKDATNLEKWARVVNSDHPGGELGLFGTSMGASAVMYSLPKMPSNVKFAIEDSGYASVEGELGGQLKRLFNIPSFPLVPTVNLYVKTLAKYNMNDGNTKKTLKHNQIPLFIIHGDADKFVPVRNAYENYRNDAGPKQIWIIKGAGHIESRSQDPDTYTQKVTDFAQQYFK
ncbi:cell surface hydrolase [Fructilactobacillus fructivorans]|uniref:alpha/beta hydrolase n=1 Tax=Fructilactobacillus fructivorans TaxID=1614 RepID=UPI0007048D9E|nr:alpha/beta hydrolase [Fructilactobacillus fructivorans]KRN12986.1 cell surface hydrolase [Fructilactobacillus fructivorans]